MITPTTGQQLRSEFERLVLLLRDMGAARVTTARRTLDPFVESSIEVRVDWPFHQPRFYSFRESELSNGGMEAFEHWRRVIIEESESICRYIGLPLDGRRTAAELQVLQSAAYARLEDTQRRCDQLRLEFLAHMANWLLSKPRDPKADERAKDLFRFVAGQKAFDALQTTAGLPLTGSAGGKYSLFPTMTYCVTRVSDGARMCAVVPGVPMYDHLLGIKLTIEHDEPMFLKTANGSPQDPNNWDPSGNFEPRGTLQRIDPTLPYLDPSDPGT